MWKAVKKKSGTRFSLVIVTAKKCGDESKEKIIKRGDTIHDQMHIVTGRGVGCC